MTWAEICDDKSLRDLPYKIETNKRGLIMMSPAKGWHSWHQTQISHLLQTLLPTGKAVVECAVETSDGVRVPDVGWFSPEQWHEINLDSAFEVAPIICVEVRSPANSDAEVMEKRDLLLEKGAVEFWLCDRAGRMTFYHGEDRVDRSVLCPAFPPQLPE